MPPTENFEQDDKRFAQRLKEFRPMVPAELKIPSPMWPRLALAAAAALLLVAALILMQSGNHLHQAVTAELKPTRLSENQPVTAAQLRVALLAGDEKLGQLLDETSPTILPHGQSGTVLFELGKE